jgi:hypothetical protein
VVCGDNAAPAFGEEYGQAVSGVQRELKISAARPGLTNHAGLCIIMHKVECSGEELRK